MVDRLLQQVIGGKVEGGVGRDANQCGRQTPVQAAQALCGYHAAGRMPGTLVLVPRQRQPQPHGV